MAHNYGSFDYKVINKNIRNILDARSQLNNTVQMAMPFVKATTTLRHELFLGKDNIGFTLGLHGINEDVEFKNMYQSQNGTSPLVGYTYTANGQPEKIYAINPYEKIQNHVGLVFDKRYTTVTYPDSSQFVRIPPPGITNVSIGRNKNGLIAMAQLQISIPSLMQLETLHRIFLVPGAGMVVEWGQQFAPYDDTNPKIDMSLTDSLTNNNVLAQKYDISPYLFPWHNREKLSEILKKLAHRQLGMDEILEKYVYPSHGQYNWMFGRVANFEVKSNSDGSFNATVKVVGPSEDAWAYQTMTTVVPGKDKSANYFCGVNSIYTYFSNTSTGLNLKTLLDRVLANEIPTLKPWKNHIKYLKQGNQMAGDPEDTTQTPVLEQKTFAESEDAYFMTWRFFVNVVINDPNYGVKAIFRQAGMDDEKLETIGLLLPYGHGPSRDLNVGTLQKVDDPRESFVGANKYLRSIDPSVMIIVNEMAAKAVEENPQYKIATDDEKLVKTVDESKDFLSATSPFELSAQEYWENKQVDKGFLSSGVWLNHKAVATALLSSDTLIRGISRLLENMNRATMNYWQLTLDAVEGDSDRKHPHSYTVIDANYRENADKAVDNFIDKVHTFNKYVKLKNGETLVGSEIIECSIDLSLPKRLFAQIAVSGLLPAEDLQKLSVNPTDANIVVTQEDKDNETSNQSRMKISDPNDTLAKMFGITSIYLTDKTGQSPDLTVLPINQTPWKGVCGQGATQTTAATAGQGYEVGGINLSQVAMQPDELKKQLDVAKKQLELDVCKQCEPCITAEETTSPRELIGVKNGVQITNKNMPGYNSLTFADTSIRPGKVSRQLLNDLNEAFSTQGVNVSGYVYSAHRDETNPSSRSNPNSRHIRGLAVDTTGIMINGNYLDVKTSDIAKNAMDNIINYLITNKGYTLTTRESVTATPKAIIWRTDGHLNHAHFSLAYDVTEVEETPNIASPENSKNICKDEDYKKFGTGKTDAELIKSGRDECAKCKRSKDLIAQVKNKKQQSLEGIERKFPGYQRVARYVEIFPELMVAAITDSSDDNSSNAFGAAPGSLSIGGDIVLPGISGLRVGELFWIDRIPIFYKAFGAFQVMSIEDTIGVDGWKTKIHARFNYLGKGWRIAMAEKLKVTNLENINVGVDG